MRRSLVRVVVLATLVVAISTAAAVAQESNPFARSELIAPKRAPAMEPIEMTVVIRSDADADATAICWITLDDRALFAGSSDDGLWTFNRDTREFRWKGVVPAHGEARIPFRVIAPKWIYGGVRSIGARIGVDEFHAPVDLWAYIDILEAPARTTEFAIPAGGILIRRTEIILIVALLTAIAVAFAARRLRPAVLIVLVFLVSWTLITPAALLFDAGARNFAKDVAMFSSWRPAQATVIDAAALYDPPDSSGGVGKKRTPEGKLVPLAAVSYTVDNKPLIAAGFWSNSHIRTTRRAERMVKPFTPGTSVTAWVNPNDVHEFVLVRTPGFGNLLFFAFVAILAFALKIAIGRMRRAAARDTFTGQPLVPPA